jgi:hypothetical protein
MDYTWVMTKSYQATSGETLPVAYSYGANHSSMGYEANGWGLAWISLDVHQLEFLLSGIDDRVVVVGQEDDPPTQLLLDTYADKLKSKKYDTLRQVLKELGKTEPRFTMTRDPNKP